MNSIIIGDDDLQFDSNDLHLTVGEFGTNIDTDINSSFFDNNIGTVIVILIVIVTSIVTIAIVIVILIIYIIYR